MLKFLDVGDVGQIHDEILAAEPGLAGTHHERLEAVMGRVKSAYAYGEIDDIFNLAAYYAVSLAQGHAFADGNKRTAFTVCMTILEINGLPVPDEVKDRHESWADLMVMVAEKKITRESLAGLIAGAYMITTVGMGIIKMAEWVSELIKK
jgi:death-on-curing protein